MFIIYRGKAYLVNNILSFYVVEQGLEIVFVNEQKLLINTRKRFLMALFEQMKETLEQNKSYNIDDALEKIKNWL